MEHTHVFISYAFVNEQHPDHLFAQRLANDLRLTGANVGIDEANTKEYHVLPRLLQMLSTCQWLAVILTPDALQSPQVHMIINTALNLVAKGHMKGILVIIASPCNVQEVPLAWRTLTVIDATLDYSRALARVLLELESADSIRSSETQSNATRNFGHGANGSALGENDRPSDLPPLSAPLYNRTAAQDVPHALPAYPVISRYPSRLWLYALSVAMALLLILVSASLLYAFTSRKNQKAATNIDHLVATPTMGATSISTKMPIPKPTSASTATSKLPITTTNPPTLSSKSPTMTPDPTLVPSGTIVLSQGILMYQSLVYGQHFDARYTVANESRGPFYLKQLYIAVHGPHNENVDLGGDGNSTPILPGQSRVIYRYTDTFAFNCVTCGVGTYTVIALVQLRDGSWWSPPAANSQTNMAQINMGSSQIIITQGMSVYNPAVLGSYFDAQYTVTNEGGAPFGLAQLYIAVRDPNGNNADLGGDGNSTPILPGQSRKIFIQTYALGSNCPSCTTGNYDAFASIQLPDSSWWDPPPGANGEGNIYSFPVS
jgi:hypothetical protein